MFERAGSDSVVCELKPLDRNYSTGFSSKLCLSFASISVYSIRLFTFHDLEIARREIWVLSFNGGGCHWLSAGASRSLFVGCLSLVAGPYHLSESQTDGHWPQRRVPPAMGVLHDDCKFLEFQKLLWRVGIVIGNCGIWTLSLSNYTIIWELGALSIELWWVNCL